MLHRLTIVAAFLAAFLLAEVARAAESAEENVSRLHVSGQYDAAHTAAEKLVVEREKQFGPEHPRTAVALVLLGREKLARGDLVGADPLLRRACGLIATFVRDHSSRKNEGP